jgi:hypothetical protein
MPRWTHVIVHHSLSGDNTLTNSVAIRRFHTSYRQGGNIITEEDFYKKQEAGEKGLIRPWKDVGYHWLLERLSDEDRRVWVLEGRSMMMHGAHCPEEGMNRRGIGVCVIGNFDIAPPPEDVFEKAASFVSWLCRMYHVPIENVQGHREYATYKSCPGEKFDLDYFRERVEDYLAEWASPASE